MIWIFITLFVMVAVISINILHSEDIKFEVGDQVRFVHQLAGFTVGKLYTITYVRYDEILSVAYSIAFIEDDEGQSWDVLYSDGYLKHYVERV